MTDSRWKMADGGWEKAETLKTEKLKAEKLNRRSPRRR
jgi:hypothetical protein